MELLSFIPMTLASVLSSFSTNSGIIEEAKIGTHVSPEIAGVWELDYQETPDFALPSTKVKGSQRVGGARDKDLENLILAVEASSRLSNEAQAAADQVDNSADSSSDKIETNVEPIKAAVRSPDCRERYNFGADNVVRTTSGEEWTYGKYIYHYPDEGLPIIAITTTYDNNQPDCSGIQIDQKGEAIIAYVDYQPQKNKMRWCTDGEANNCFLSFKQLLP
ncbi:hypothetical protein [Psychrobacter sp.]|uniref:hypothetical protein n=1 Tax=Psychrobacter sp. TaxID=56811 RepID=UPI0025F2DAA3|nr:hypothetical protein [Psychrobacter sp.]